MNSLKDKNWTQIFNRYKTIIKGKLKDENVKKYIRLLAIPLVVVVLIIVIVVAGNTKKIKPDGDTGSGDVITIADTSDADGNENGIDSKYQLKKNVFPEVNQVIETYFKAISECDVDTLSKILDTLAEGEPEQLKQKLDKEKEYIEGYENIDCYTKDGLEENSYIVYIYYELKFVNIDTLAPGLISLYVTKDEDGTVSIYNGAFEGELAAYVDEVSKDEDVKKLSEEVEYKLNTALSSDTELNNFYNKLVEGAGNIDTEEGTSGIADESNTTQSETAAN